MGFYDQRNVPTNHQAAEHTGDAHGTTGTAPTHGAGEQGLGVAAANEVVTPATIGPQDGIDKGGGKGAFESAIEGNKTLNSKNLPGGGDNPAIKKAEALYNNASPQVQAMLDQAGVYMAQHPEQTPAIIDQLLAKGEIVIPGQAMVNLESSSKAGAGLGSAASAATAAPSSAGSAVETSSHGSSASVSTGGSTSLGRASSNATSSPATVSSNAQAASSTGPSMGTYSSRDTGEMPMNGASGMAGTHTMSVSPYDHAISNMGLNEGDIEQIAFIVLMAATNDMDKDLKMIMAETKAMTAAKQKLRDLISKVSKDYAANSANPKDKDGKYTEALKFPSGLDYNTASTPYPNPDPDAAGGVSETNIKLAPEGGFTQNNPDQIKAVQDDMKSKLDSMNEMSEQASLRLQMAMDRRSKFVSTLSNVMKKISSTQDSVVQNLK